MDNLESKNFLELVNTHNELWKKFKSFQFEEFHARMDNEMKRYENIDVGNVFLSEIDFESCEFRNCTFDSLQIIHGTIGQCEFTDCIFSNCDISFTDFFNVQFTNVQFIEVTLGEGVFADAIFENTTFKNCREIIEIRFGSCSFNNTKFNNCRLSYLTFENLVEAEFRSIDFIDCIVSHNTFYWFNLDKTKFDDCLFEFCNFNNCRIVHATFLNNNRTSEREYCSIDLQTILKSDIPLSILEKHFGVHNSFIKNYVFEMVSKLELHTVFISYSFSDKVIANRINEALKARGVFTFLWEKDSPAGQKLKKIMSYNVNNFDRLLFIASKNSLKSEACHFELSNGRKKQDKYWDVVLFPIHIDNFLFSVDENDIPRKNREEFWKNIEELREINSQNFSLFTQDNVDQMLFDEAIDKLVIALRKKNDS